MTATQLTLAAVTAVLAIIGVVYHRSPLPIEKAVGDPVIEIVRWMLLIPAAIMLIGELVMPHRLTGAHLPITDSMRMIGGIVAVVATALVAWAFAALGPNFATTLVIREGHELVTEGPYRWVRHPMYTLGFVLLVGLAVLTANWVVLFTGPTAMAVLMIVRVPKEERMLAEHFGDEWRVYASRTGRLVPRVFGSADSR